MPDVERCEDCGLVFDESELDVDGLCIDCRIEGEEEDEDDETQPQTANE